MPVLNKTVLMVVTSHDELAPGKPTGLWLEEFAIPWQLFREAGLKVSIASPLGGNVPIDPRSIEDEDKVVAWREAENVLLQTASLDELQLHKFDAIFLPGGHGAMFDLPENPVLKALLHSQIEAGRIVAAVCHGPAALVEVSLSDGRPLVAGRTLTAFTDAEERAVGLEDAVPFLLEAELRAKGADFVAGELWASHVEVDDKLVTGQNPASSAATAEAVIRLLRD
nr:type 1 glutamine amidotransferase domain-containing protein [Geothermobacter hydrogeniphilus]